MAMEIGEGGFFSASVNPEWKTSSSQMKIIVTKGDVIPENTLKRREFLSPSNKPTLI